MISRLWRAGLDRPLLADTALAFVIGVTIALPLLTGYPEITNRSGPWTPLWVALGGVPIAIRRWRPLVAVAAVAVYTDVSLIVPRSWYLVDTGIPLIIVTYTLAAWTPLRRTMTVGALLWIPMLCLDVTRAAAPSSRLSVPYVITVDLVLWVVLVLTGRVVWNRRAYALALRERALAAEANQEALTARAVADERRRIARELHDVVAHHISVMGVLASGARRSLARDPEAADEALATIEQTGRGVLREMRRLLSLLRTDDTDPNAATEPQPGLLAIVDLVEQVREAGLTITCAIDPRLEDLDSGVAVTVYRITQEALTNVLKHANAPTAQVRLTLDDQALALEVSDTGRGPAPDRPQSGFGLIGMRERVAFYGGSLRVGPRPGGGFRVRVTIPLEAK